MTKASRRGGTTGCRGARHSRSCRQIQSLIGTLKEESETLEIVSVRQTDRVSTKGHTSEPAHLVLGKSAALEQLMNAVDG